MPGEPVAVGIDLGTSNSVTAVWREDLRTTTTIKDLGHAFTPSVVGFSDAGERLVGHTAKQQQKVNPRNTVHGIKQIIGRQFLDKEVALAARHWPFQVVQGHDGTCRVLVKARPNRPTHIRPEEISAAVLSRLVSNAATKLNADIKGAVITVPATFTNNQRLATQNAAAIAGLKVLKLMNEPSAAAYSYCATDLDSEQHDRYMLIFDLGGGTLDLALLFVPARSADDNTDNGIKVRGVDADLSLGGDTFTGRLAQYCLQELPAVSGFDQSMFMKPLVKHMIYMECENVKQQLSECLTANVNIQLGGDASAKLEITRDKFEQLCEEDFRRIHQPLMRVLDAAGLQRRDVSRVLLVGGSTQIPAVRNILNDFFNGKVELNEQVDPAEAVAHGAAIEAARICGNWKPPLNMHRSYSDKTDMNHQPEQMVSGLAGTFGHLNRHTLPVQPRTPLQLPVAQLPPRDATFDVLPHTLSIVYNQGECYRMLDANTSYPARKQETFDKQWPDQANITISIMEGPSLWASENQLLGRFDISGLRHLRLGIIVTFYVNSSGIIEVSAQALEDASKLEKIIVQAVDAPINPQELDRLIKVEKMQGAALHEPGIQPELQQALHHLGQLFEQQDTLAGQGTQQHVQLIKDELMEMKAEGKSPSLGAVQNYIHRFWNVPVVAGSIRPAPRR